MISRIHNSFIARSASGFHPGIVAVVLVAVLTAIPAWAQRAGAGGQARMIDIDGIAAVVNAAIGNKARMDEMKSFFGGTGMGDSAGVWEGKPQERPEFRTETRRRLDKAAKKRKAEEMI